MVVVVVVVVVFVCACLVLYVAVSACPTNSSLCRYAPGQGIAAHEDGPLYTPHFAIISLGCSLLLRFWSKRTDTAPPQRVFSVLMEPGSLLLVCKNAYLNMLHGKESRKRAPLAVPMKCACVCVCVCVYVVLVQCTTQWGSLLLQVLTP